MDETVLLVDDDKKLVDLLTEYLEGNGFDVVSLRDGSAIIETIDRAGPDLAILDIMLPGSDGLDLLRMIRKRYDLPVIMLTAKGEETDRIVGLELGADDYLPKPFNPRELLARMKAVLRRAVATNRTGETGTGRTLIRAGGMVLDISRRILLVGDAKVDLSSTEFEILKALMSKPDIVLTRDMLMNMARGRDHMAFDRSVDVHISKLRSKLAAYPEGKDRIRTVWGEGYVFVGEP